MLEVKNLTACLQGKIIIKDINAVFKKGQVSVLMGPNGSGKSTLLRSLIKLTDIKEGTILIDGLNCNEVCAKELAQRIAYMPQSRNVPDITVKRLVLHGRFPYLSYPRKYNEKDWEVVEKVLDELSIKNLADRNLTELSGGQRQRVYLAMALTQETDVILMDEPATFLDIKSQLDVLEIAGNLAKMGKTVIMVLHDFESILRCADEVFLINEGKLIKFGNPEKVLISDEVKKVFEINVKIIETEGEKHCFISK